MLSGAVEMEAKSVFDCDALINLLYNGNVSKEITACFKFEAMIFKKY